MRRTLIQSLKWFSPIALILVLASLAIYGWQQSVVTQHMRIATARVANRLRLVDHLGQWLRESEHAEQAYLVAGAGPDMITYRNADLRVNVITARLAEPMRAPAARGEDADAAPLDELVSLVGRRQAVLAREAALRTSGMAPALLLEQHTMRGQPPAREVLNQVGLVRERLESERQRLLDSTSESFVTVRWIAAAVALTGVGGLLVTWIMLRRAWSHLVRAETEQRTAALQLRGSLDSLSQGVAVFCADGRLLNWNMRLRQMLDLPAALLQQGLAYDALEAHLRAGGGSFLEPLEAIRRDLPDRERPAVVYERTVPQRPGKSAGSGSVAAGPFGERNIDICRTLMPGGGFVLALTDMTERSQAERMLRVAQKMQAVGELTGGIAHDFNNLLTVILGSLELLPDDLLGAGTERSRTASEQVRRAVQAAESGAALTRQLLAFARREPLAPVPVDLSVALPGLRSLLRPAIGEAIGIDLVVQPDLWPATVDAAQLESAVLNLSLNARDAMPGGGLLVIKAENVALEPYQARQIDLDAGDFVRVAVSDTGQGMSPDVLARAFEPFFTTKPEGRGTGLGLAMVFGFARQSGGAVSIRSQAGQGTTVALYLPRASAAVAAAAVAGALPGADPPSLMTRRMHPSSPEPARHPSILVVEDDPAVREIAAEILRELGYRVSEAADPDAALRILSLRDHPLDLLLTDIVLPGTVDGRELAREARGMHPRLQVIFMSGYSETDSLPGDGAAGEESQALLGKPFRRAQLAAMVADMIGVSSRTGEAA
ncbi:ATP-binding protein [Lichenicoccus sp.]|uniref:ATP-binding protein n=1 Tax=Lichenicoccus sp. TaxID=2781899 RepID=UPI003D10F383